MLYELAQLQRQLDNRIIKSHNITDKNVYEEKKMAMLVELGELANELRFFKFWKKDPQPSFDVVCGVCNGRTYIAFGGTRMML